MGPWRCHQNSPGAATSWSVGMETFVWTGLEALKPRLTQVAGLDIAVLLSGESGTGKTQVATFIHENSARAQHTIRRVACPAIPGDLFESELFGHEKGAFTGAVSERRGEVELAHGGTLFLEEVGDLDLRSQAKLLAFLDNRRYRRVGGTNERDANVRILSATHRNLQEDIREGRFLAPLYYRLRQFEFQMPPLHKRRNAIPELVSAFVFANHRRLGHKSAPQIEPDAEHALKYATYGGNIRDLESLLVTAMVLTRDGFPITRQILIQSGLPLSEELQGAGGRVEWIEETDELAVYIREVAHSLPGFANRSTDPYFVHAVFAQARHLIKEMEAQLAQRTSREASANLLRGLSFDQDTHGFYAALYSLAITIRWDLDKNHNYYTRLTFRFLSQIYDRESLLNPRSDALLVALRRLLIPRGEL